MRVSLVNVFIIALNASCVCGLIDVFAQRVLIPDLSDTLYMVQIGPSEFLRFPFPASVHFI